MVASTALPNAAWKKMLRNTGSSRMNPAPKNGPMIVPRPPMIAMNRMRKERLMSNAAGSTERR